MNHPLLRSSVLALILVLGLSGASMQSSAGAQAQPAPAAIGPVAVIPAAGACFSAALSGTSEVPPNDSDVTGYATVVLAPSQQSITAYISYTGELSGTETRAKPPSASKKSLPSRRTRRGARSRNAGSLYFTQRSAGSTTCESAEITLYWVISRPPIV